MAPPPDVIRILHRVNGTTSFLCGLAANLLLIALVLRSRLAAYKRLLLQMTFVDFTFLVLTAIVDPIIVLVDGNEIVLQNEYFRRVPQPWNGIMCAVWVFGLYFTICSICVQFLFRYFILCRQHTASNRTMVFMLGVPAFLSVLIALLYHVGFVYQPQEDRFATELLKELLLESAETSVFPGGISRRGNIKLIALASCAVALMGANYIIIVFCVTRISATLRELAPSLKASTRALHAQLSKTMMVQALAPLVVSIGPLSYLCWAILSQSTAFLSMMVMTVGFSWVPFTNATLTIIIVKQFRRSVFAFFRGMRRSVATRPETTTTFNTTALFPQQLDAHAHKTTSTAELTDSDFAA